jgi:hypothetical protein
MQFSFGRPQAFDGVKEWPFAIAILGLPAALVPLSQRQQNAGSLGRLAESTLGVDDGAMTV